MPGSDHADERLLANTCVEWDQERLHITDDELKRALHPWPHPFGEIRRRM